jgi:hypothetical protein
MSKVCDESLISRAVYKYYCSYKIVGEYMNKGGVAILRSESWYNPESKVLLDNNIIELSRYQC